MVKHSILIDPQSWNLLDAIVGGASALDVPILQIDSLQEAEDFMACYGFDWSDPSHRAELQDIRRLAISFIEEDLLWDEPDLEIDYTVRDQEDPRQLLRWASLRRSGERQRWACAVLRVMHTVAHSQTLFNERYGEHIREQILARFTPHLHRDDAGMTLGLGPEAIPLADFQFKHSKPLRSVMIKLLQKVENVAADIFDRVGVRFVTRDRLDTLLVIDYLRNNNVIMFANIKPSRSRNTLIDLGWLKQTLSYLDEESRAGRLPRYQRLKVLRRMVRERPFPGPPEPSANAYSSVAYHSVQFTSRQMIRVPGNAHHLQDMIKAILASGHDDSETIVGNLLARLGNFEDTRFFFPFEVQVLDDESYQNSRSGLASHDIYKGRQRKAVKTRVLGSLLNREPDPDGPYELISSEPAPTEEFEPFELVLEDQDDPQ